jgi:alkanesulfonate monooxygenase SsuD/methylene tetrahydromethanopterin reductase-like flavin-dependent oxidoreductase (luciferase family)
MTATDSLGPEYPGVPAVDVLYPHSPLSAAEVLPFARLVHDRGAGRLWCGQSLHLDGSQVAAALAGQGAAVPFGTSVALMHFRHPYAAALEARSLSVITGRSVVAGFGIGAPQVAESFTGSAQADPVGFAREYVGTVRDLLRGQVVDRQHGPLPMTCMLLPERRASVEVALGALRPKMAAAAGEVADAVVTWLTPPEYLDSTLVPAVRAGIAGRARPGGCRVVTVVQLALQRPGRDLIRTVYEGTKTHLAEPTYAGMLRLAGIPVSEQDTRSAAESLLTAGVVAAGSIDDALRVLQRYREAGAGTVVLDTSGVLRLFGIDAAVKDLKDIIQALHPPETPGQRPARRTDLQEGLPEPSTGPGRSDQRTSRSVAPGAQQ